MTFKNTIEAYDGLREKLELEGEEYQNKSVRSKPDNRIVKEILGVSWKVIDPSDVVRLIEMLEPSEGHANNRLEWLSMLGQEFISPIPIFPSEVNINPYYSYSQRIYWQLPEVIKHLNNTKDYPDRQGLMAIWKPLDIMFVEGSEVPCSIAYHFLLRGGCLRLVYYMRSLNLETWPNDVYLSRVVRDYVACQIGASPSSIMFLVGSLHTFRRRDE